MHLKNILKFSNISNGGMWGGGGAKLAKLQGWGEVDTQIWIVQNLKSVQSTLVKIHEQGVPLGVLHM